jgi:hypothetical protein
MSFQERDLFAKMHFSDEQLNAIRQIYYKYFHEHMPDDKDYVGRATSVMFYKGAEWKLGEGHDRNHKVGGFVIPEAREDPLWGHFKDIMPYMEPVAVITKLPAGKTMHPHVDRKWRPEAIYFPIEGCSDKCISEYYDIPKADTENSQSKPEHPTPIYSYCINTHAYLTNTHEWHGVRNESNMTRIAFGWNFKQTEMRSYAECRDIMIKLGYVHE